MNTEQQLERFSHRLAEDGFVVMPNLCNAGMTERILKVSKARASEILASLGDREIGIGSAAGYEEIVQRSPGRWDVPIGLPEFGFCDADMPWLPYVREILGDNAESSFSGVVFSDPATPAQCWHIDSPHVSIEHRDAHALNVLMALHDIPLEMGPTEFAVGSHRLTNHLSNPSLLSRELVYQHAHVTPALLVAGTGVSEPRAAVSGLAAGTCVLFDDRLLHRGLANRTGDVRLVAYFSYRRQGYRENTHFEATRSLNDPGSFRPPKPR